MPLTDQQITGLAQAHIDARVNVKKIPNATDLYPDITFDESYAVQTRIMELRVKGGDPVVGHKAGFSTKSAQIRFDMSQPAFGHFHASMIVPEGEPISLSKMTNPFIEGELAFVLGEDIKGPGVTLPRVMAAIAGMMPAFEIADGHLNGPPKNAQDIIAENAAASMIMFGGQFTRIDGVDVRQIGHILEKNGEIIGTAAAVNTSFNPVQPIVYLANKLAQFGIGLKAGEFIITGTPLPAVTAQPGTVLRSTFDRTGYVTVRFIA